MAGAGAVGALADAQNWRTGVTAEDYFRGERKQNALADRRPVIRQASDLVGPGIAATATDLANESKRILDGVIHRGEVVEIRRHGKGVATVRRKVGVTRNTVPPCFLISLPTCLASSGHFCGPGRGTSG